MRALRAHAPEREVEPGHGDRGLPPPVPVAPLVAVALAGFAIAAFYLVTYLAHRFAVPLGWDTPGYAWRTNYVRAFGVANLPASISNPGPVNPGRPAFAVLAALIGSVGRVDPFRVAAILPATMAAGIGLAAGALVSTSGRRPRAGDDPPRWTAAVLVTVAVAVGTSVFVVRLVNVEGYQDATVAAAVLVAGMTAALLAARQASGVLPAALILGTAGVAHWDMFLVGGAVLAVAAAAHVPASVRAVRAGARPFATPAARLAAATAGGAALALITILGLLTAGVPSPRLDGPQFLEKIGRDLPGYHLPVLLALAGAGALVLAHRASGEGASPSGGWGPLLRLLLSWCEVTLLFFVAGWLLARPVPTHRVLALCLALPVLAVVALLAAGRRLGSAMGGRARPAGALIVLAGLALSAGTAQADWWSFHPVMHPSLVVQARLAAAYLDAERVAASRPVVFVTDDRSKDAWSRSWLSAPVIRSALPAARVTSAFFYVGRPEDYLARRPTRLPFDAATAPGGIDPGRYDALSVAYFADVRPTYARRPVALVLSAANAAERRWARTHPASVVAPGVAVVRGPSPSSSPAPLPVPPAAAPSALLLVLLAAGTLIGLGAAGAGWTWALLGDAVGWVETVALGPAVGAGMLVLVGIVLNRAGLPLRGPGAVAIATAGAGGGWALGAARARRRTRPTTGGRARPTSEG